MSLLTKFYIENINQTLGHASSFESMYSTQMIML